MMNSYKVGEVVPQLKTGGNYIQIGYGDGLWELRMGYPAITPKEVQELQSGDFRMAITCIDDALFFLFSIGDTPWSDTPYEPRLISPPDVFSTDHKKGMGAPLLLLIADTETGVIKGMRFLGLGELLTSRLHSICTELNQKRPLNVDAYNAKLNLIYAKYPSTDSLLKTVAPTDVFLLLNNSTTNEPPKGFAHVTLNSGHCMFQTLEFFTPNPKLNENLRQLVQDSSRSGGVKVVNNIFFEMTEEPDAYVGTVYSHSNGMKAPILTTFGAKTEKAGKKLWNGVQKELRQFPVGGKIMASRPHTPFVADYVFDFPPNPQILDFFQSGMSGDFTKCIGWALLFPEVIAPEEPAK